MEIVCRACLETICSKKYDIFRISHLSRWLRICASITVQEDDGLPKYLCPKCFSKIEDFYEFRTMCIESARKLNQTFSNNFIGDVKNEVMFEIHNIDEVDDNNKINKLTKNENFESQKSFLKEEKQSQMSVNVVNALVNIVQTSTLSKQQNEVEDSYNEEKIFEANLDVLCEEDEKYARNNGETNFLKSDEDTINHDSYVNKDLEGFGTGNCSNGDFLFLEADTEIINEVLSHDKRSRKIQKEYEIKDIFNKKNYKNKVSDDENGMRTRMKDQETFICQICNKRYFKKEKFEACVRSHKGLKPWVCPECKKEYRKKASLINHIKYEHKKNCEMYACPVEGCDKKYRLKQTMQVHYRRIHIKDLTIKDSKKIKLYICEQCGKSLRTLNALNQHRFIHTGDFPYKCDECPKRCGTRYQLEVHLKRHKGIKNYICPICGLKKITQQELNTHMNYHSRDKTYTCKLCPYTSCNNGNVVRHERIVHHGIKTFECRFCSKTFGKAETLKHHVMTHTGEKPHQCNLCGRRFIQPTALKTHLKRHDKATTVFTEVTELSAPTMTTQMTTNENIVKNKTTEQVIEHSKTIKKFEVFNSI